MCVRCHARCKRHYVLSCMVSMLHMSYVLDVKSDIRVVLYVMDLLCVVRTLYLLDKLGMLYILYVLYWHFMC